MIPSKILPDDDQIRGNGNPTLDVWAFKLLLDASRDWSGSTFAVDSTLPDPYVVALDDSHKGDDVPYILLTVPSATTEATDVASFRFNIAESPILNRSFCSQTVRLAQR